MIIMEEKTYEIFTDASFDDITKIGTYAIVIMQEQKIVKTIAKKCNVQLENSTECEVFAIFQAINFIEGSLLKKQIIQKFWLRTDCAVAKDFFIKRSKIKIFKKNVDLLDTINKSYERITKTLSKKDCSFRLKWIPRGANKIAHKHSYSVFKRLKVVNEKNEILVIKKKTFIEILSKFNKRQCEIIIYLFKISNEQKLILRTQKEIAEEVNISVVSINKVFQVLINLNVLQKVKNGKYALLI